MAMGLLFHAVPDDLTAILGVSATGHPKVLWPNVLVFNQTIRRYLTPKGKMVRVRPGADTAIERLPWVINYCADPDEYSLTLEALSKAMRRSLAMTGVCPPVFNAPPAVLDTRRDRVSEKLQGIPDLEVPRCARLQVRSAQTVIEEIELRGFSYPVLVRPVRSQTGAGLVRVDCADQMNVGELIGRECYITEFVDFMGGDGDYTKIRLAVAGSHWQVRHVHFGKGWQVHNQGRGVKKVRRELLVVDELRHDDRLGRIMAEMMRRIPLDYWGVDLGYAGANRDLLFFEGNAAMSMLFNHQPPSPGSAQADVRLRKMAIGKELEQRLAAHLANPVAWRSNRAGS